MKTIEEYSEMLARIENMTRELEQKSRQATRLAKMILLEFEDEECTGDCDNCVEEAPEARTKGINVDEMKKFVRELSLDSVINSAGNSSWVKNAADYIVFDDYDDIVFDFSNIDFRTKRWFYVNALMRHRDHIQNRISERYGIRLNVCIKNTRI